MKVALLILVGLFVASVVAYYFLFPRNSFMIFKRAGGGTVAFSRTGISLGSAPDHYPANGIDHLEPYVSRLLVPSKHFKGLHLFTPDGNRGCGLQARDGAVKVVLTVEWRREPQREAAIRSFFSSLATMPSRDYLAGNGGVPDATRIVEYPIKGSTAEVTALTKRILQELCSISPTEGLDVSYRQQ